MAEKVVIGNAELWHGDCREVLPLLPRFELLLTDPPYGLAIGRPENNKRGRYGKQTGAAHEASGWDDEAPSSDLLALVTAKRRQGRKPAAAAPAAGGFDDNLDDDIPF